MRANGRSAEVPWWRNAAIYEVYVRSFADSNGDGIGDLDGVRSRLPYLAELGIDALWFTPWYASPMADGGYDVADYRTIDPAFGTLEQARALISEADAHGIRTIVDIVPNHLSDQHRWFVEALAAEAGAPERDRFWFRPGRDGGSSEPNNWTSIFGGPAWSRTKNPDGTPGEWYLHLFAPGQPDLNWSHPAVRAEHEDVLRFWFDCGAAGVRIDSAALLVKDAELPDMAGEPAPGAHPYQDRDELHEVYRSWRAIADSYSVPRVLVGEVWLPDGQRFARYLAPDELHTAFNFDFLACPWDSERLRTCIDQTLDLHVPIGAPATWVLSNHDVTRPVTRYGRADTSFSFAGKRTRTETDLSLGRRRARAAAMLAMALPGTLYLYQGEELGLPEVEDLAAEHLQDPMHFRSGGTDPGRDGCRVPLPWSGTVAPYGFSPSGSKAATWLPQPASWAELSVERQGIDPASMLSFYRTALQLRRTQADLHGSDFSWVPAPPQVLRFRRGGDFTCVVNLSDSGYPLPADAEPLLTSQSLADPNVLESDTAAWLRLAPRT